MHDVVKLHNHHGPGALLSDNFLSARKKETSLDCALVFTQQPLKPRNKVCFTLDIDGNYPGGLKIGLTSFEPGSITPEDLPKRICPDCTRLGHYWTCAIPLKWTCTGDIWTLRLTDSGQLLCSINGINHGEIIINLPTNLPLWLIWDVYGSIRSVQIIPAERTPLEIIASGPKATHSFEAACLSGTVSLNRTRLMLVGPWQSGKTTLKKRLMGKKANHSQVKTAGIDLSTSCSFASTCNGEPWQSFIHRPLSPSAPSETLIPIDDMAYIEDENTIIQILFWQKQSKSKKDEQLLQGLPPERVNGIKEKLAEFKKQELPPHAAEDPSGDLDERKNELHIWDFAGESLYYTTHQMFLSSRAVYLIVFNLCQDLEAPTQVSIHTPKPSQGLVEISTEDEELSILETIHHWLAVIYAHSAQQSEDGQADGTESLSPPVFIVGTHLDALAESNRSELVKEKFHRIRCSLEDKPYRGHVISEFYALDCLSDDPTSDLQLINFRSHVEKVTLQQSYFAEKIPSNWLSLEQALVKLAHQGILFTSIEQIQHLALEYDVEGDEELHTLIRFYHSLGSLLYFGHIPDSPVLHNTVVLQPAWLAQRFRDVIGARPSLTDRFGSSWLQLLTSGQLEEQLLKVLWPSCDASQVTVLLGLMQALDLMLEYKPSMALVRKDSLGHNKRLFFVPATIQPTTNQAVSLFQPKKNDVVFFYDFNGFLPAGVFYQLVVKCAKWSQDSIGHTPQMVYHSGRFGVDDEHDVILEIESLRHTRVKVVIQRVLNADDTDKDSVHSHSSSVKSQAVPRPHSSAKVRNFLETTLDDIRSQWFRRLSYQACVQCPCTRQCGLHDSIQCSDTNCLHFLNLDHCLANKVVSCEHRRVKTAPFRKWFPAPRAAVTGSTVPLLCEGFVNPTAPKISSSLLNDVPSWIKSVAKMLNAGDEEEDWKALATIMGYKRKKVDEFEEDPNPGLMLLTDFIICTGNTSQSVDVLQTYLEEMHRDDIADYVLKENEDTVEPPQVFISYQWDHQDEVSLLRERIETAGFTCWMDIGQMGGGDELYKRIDQGIRNAKVVVACLSPKYLASHYCTRELNLADLLVKPIIPVLVEHVPWPPPGAVSLVLAHLVYINMKGVGGHGGTGMHADTESRYQEIIQRLSTHADPKCRPTINLSSMDLKSYGQDQTTLSVPPSDTPQSRVIASNRIRSALSTRTNLTTGIDSLRPAYSRHLSIETGVLDESQGSGCCACTIL